MSTSTYAICPIHGTFHPAGSECSVCYALRAPLRDTLNILEARIADLESRLLSTNRQLAELQTQRISDVQAHNALAPYVLVLAARAGLLP